MMCNHASGQLLPEHMWKSQLREHTRNTRHLDLHPPRKHKQMFMRQHCCARTQQAHLDLLPRAKNMFRRQKLLRSYAAGTLESSPVHKHTCSCDNAAAFARNERTWIFYVHKETCSGDNYSCISTPRAHVGLPPYAQNRSCDNTAALALCDCTWIPRRAPKKHVPAKKLLRSHAACTLGSCSVRKQTCSFEKMAVFSRREHTWISPMRKQDDMFMRQTAALAHHKHTWISLFAQ